MPTITFNQWDFGLDLRKGPSTSDANRLRMLKNAKVTGGKRIRKRNGFTRIATLPPGTQGLFAGLGKLNTFQVHDTPGPDVALGGIFQNNILTKPSLATDGTLARVMAVEVFGGALYVAAEHIWYPGTNAFVHHYTDVAHDAPAPGTQVNGAPAVASIAKASSKIYSADGDVVKYCATNTPRDWTTPDDAGFLPVGLQQSGNKESVTCGNYQNRLVVYFPDSSQVWAVDPDPANNQFETAIDIGTRHLYAHQNMANDVFFLSPAGVRTITRQANTESLIDSDVGSPIDSELLKGALMDLDGAKGQYVRSTGQYWLYSGTKAVVFTFSRSSKISAWSVYEFPFPLDYIDELDAQLYVRSGDDVYRMDRDVWSDGGILFDVEIESAYLDFKVPGVLKQIGAMDAVTSGTADSSHRHDPRIAELETAPPVTITGDTRPGNRYPVELMTTNLCTVVRNRDDAEFELHSISYEYFPLGPV